ncbi:MAG: MarR family transcriptional regulator [Alphaproteobacteria bacterium]|nr:MarR family transcriptional regulator [Alphaproteobacteria bacterium]
MTSRKSGSIGEFASWTRQVVRNASAARGVPKHWMEKASRSAPPVKAESLVKLLNAKNIRLLRLIGNERPDSMTTLARRSGRKPSNLSRTLKRMARAGLVDFVKGQGRRRFPRLLASRLRLEIDFSAEERR